MWTCSASGRPPAGTERHQRTVPGGSPTATSVEPPPTSTTATSPGSACGESSVPVAPRKASRASSRGVRISTSVAAAARIAAHRASGSSADRSAAVPTTRTTSTSCRRAMSRWPLTAAHRAAVVAATAGGASAAVPSGTKARATTTVRRPSGVRSATSSRVVLVPMSTQAQRRTRCGPAGPGAMAMAPILPCFTLVSTETAIAVSDLRKSYGAFEAVRGISFSVGRGEVFGLLGPNGAGKTTTVEILEGYRHRTSGEVSVLGFDPGDRPVALRQRTGIVLQSTGMYRHIRVREAVATGPDVPAPARRGRDHRRRRTAGEAGGHDPRAIGGQLRRLTWRWRWSATPS